MEIKKAKSKKNKPLKRSSNQFPVVGVGASAGGLDAFKKLLKSIPEKSGVAYVLIQHLDPKRDSLLPELLQKITRIPVSEITNDMQVKPDHIYVIPSNKMLIANDGILHLSPRKVRPNQNLPIDLFFTSLAEVHQTHSIGVVLSGTAYDGTLGLKAIKEKGGITFAQSEESAAFGDMPRNAVSSGVVDFILPPERIPEKILEVISIMKQTDGDPDLLFSEAVVIKQILSLLKLRKGTDFTYYKQTTIKRRILRRMAITKKEKPSSYLKYLKANVAEQDLLYQDMLIPVTSFFRDNTIFNNLTSIFPHILKNKKNNEPLRMWVAGCSTGEEAYTLAICLKEFLKSRQERIQIFATDISEPAIAKARSGIYAPNEVSGLSALRLQRFFTKVNGNFHINKELREMCIFAVHDFLKDPPFGKMDLISCRNVLIYLDPYLQKKAFNTFHFSLNPKGFLLLGKSETTSIEPDLFSVASRPDRIFTRKESVNRFKFEKGQDAQLNFSTKKIKLANETARTDFQKAAYEIILSKYTPSGIIVNEAMDIVHFHGDNSAWLQLTAGKPSHNLLKLAKTGLAFELRNILHKAKKEKRAVIRRDIAFNRVGIHRTTSIEAIPLQNTVEPYYLVLFHVNPDKESQSKSDKKTTRSKAQKREDVIRIKQLEKELAQTHEDMRSITKDQESANEELQSVNEELQSSSEELQSLNEELETSKEELQSSNEELLAVNQQLTALNVQIIEERDFAKGIIATVRGPLIVLDKSLIIKAANDSFYDTFLANKNETEGKLFFELGNRQWDNRKLRSMLESVLPKKEAIFDFEITQMFPAIGKRTMLLNAREINKHSTTEKLILLSIEDITERKKDEDKTVHEMHAQKKYQESLEETMSKRTAELQDANIALQEKNTDLQRVNTELESFAYVSSHDLQEPLRKIQILVSRIYSREGKLFEKEKDSLDRIKEAASRMQSLIKDLLTYSRIAHADRTFVVKELSEVVEDVKKDLKEAIEEKNATIKVHANCRVNIIPFQFHQMMFNLIANSLKFSVPGRPPMIHIKSKVVKGAELLKSSNNAEVSKLQPDENYCHISVSDNGIGFESKYSTKIFDVFQRLYKDEYPGTGVGLAIVKRIIENHGGIITATGKLNKEATFDIYIPHA